MHTVTPLFWACSRLYAQRSETLGFERFFFFFSQSAYTDTSHVAVGGVWRSSASPSRAPVHCGCPAETHGCAIMSRVASWSGHQAVCYCAAVAWLFLSVRVAVEIEPWRVMLCPLAMSLHYPVTRKRVQRTCNRGGDGKDPAVPESICLPLDAEGPSFTALLVFVRCEHGMPRPR